MRPSNCFLRCRKQNATRRQDESDVSEKRPYLWAATAHTAPYLRLRRPKSSTASKRSFFVKSGQSFGVTYISV
jgi:hypothetical protein